MKSICCDDFPLVDDVMRGTGEGEHASTWQRTMAQVGRVLSLALGPANRLHRYRQFSAASIDQLLLNLEKNKTNRRWR